MSGKGKEMEAKFARCFMCYGPDAETQERLKDRKPVSGCHLCAGLGILEVRFKKGLEGNEIRTLGKRGKAGFFIVQIAPIEDQP